MSVDREFRLERVLRLREQKEKDLQGQLARIYQRQLEQEQLLAQMNNNRRSQIEMINRELTSERVEMTYLQFGTAYLERLQSLIERQSNVVHQVTRSTDQKRVEVHQAMKARKAIEKLRERWWDALVEEDRQRDIKIVDEISTIQFNRRRGHA